MYDELIRSCRACATGYEGNCDNCMFSGEDCYKQLHKASAEAIEAQDRHILTLQHEMMAEAESHNALVERLNKQIEVLSKTENTTHWIPVTKRLPKTRESILGKKSSKVIVAFRFDDGTQGTDTAHTLNGEWVFEDHITVVARTITHWMPIPEPPKEET